MTVSIEKQVDTMAAQSVVARRRPGAQSRIVVLEQCAAPQASVAKVAMPHGLNANLVHGWRKPARERDGAALLPSRPVCVPVNPAAPTRTGSPQFMPLSLDAMAGEPAPVDIQIEAWKFNAGTPPAQTRGPAGAPAARGPWARTSAGGWTSNRRSSSCSARSAAIQGEGPLPLNRACKCCQLLVREPAAPRVSTTRCQHRACRLKRCSAALSITSRTTGNSRSTLGPVCARRARRWRPAAGTPARRRCHSKRRTGHSCPAARWCMPTRRRSVCLTLAGARRSRACMCAYAQGAFEAEPGVVIDFCAGRGGQCPCAFLKGVDGHVGGRCVQRP